jgi:hypothetical protein
MEGYIVITDLKSPSMVRAKLAASMVDIATCVVVPPDTVRVEVRNGVELSNEDDLNLVVHLIMRGVQDCNETDAKTGVFRE